MSLAELKTLIEDRPPVFVDSKENERFYRFAMTEYVKNLQSQNVRNVMLDKQLENATKNALLPHGDLLSLEATYYTKTTLGLAFGPSLMVNREDVIAASKKYKSVVVDRGMDWFYQNGVKIDVVVTSDAYASADWINDEHDLRGVKLIAYSGSNHEFIKKFISQGGVVYYYNYKCRAGSDVELNKVFPVKTYIPVAGNVGYVLMSVAMSIFKSKKLILAGFDNSWGEYYYPDMKDDAMPKQHTTVDVNGEEVYTNDEFILYNFYMSELVHQYNLNDAIINCTEGGILRLPSNEKLKKYV